MGRSSVPPPPDSPRGMLKMYKKDPSLTLLRALAGKLRQEHGLTLRLGSIPLHEARKGQIHETLLNHDMLAGSLAALLGSLFDWYKGHLRLDDWDLDVLDLQVLVRRNVRLERDLHLVAEMEELIGFAAISDAEITISGKPVAALAASASGKAELFINLSALTAAKNIHISQITNAIVEYTGGTQRCSIEGLVEAIVMNA